MGVARLYAALATGAGDDRRWDAIETEYRRTVALLGTDHRARAPARRVAGPPALGGAAQPVRRLAVRAPGPPARAPARDAARRPRARTRPAPRPAHRQRRGGRAPEHRLAAVDHADHVGLLRAAVEPGGTWADIGAGEGAFTLALADLLGPGGRIVAVDRDGRALARERGCRPWRASPTSSSTTLNGRPDRPAGPPRAGRSRRGQQPPLRPARPAGGGHPGARRAPAAGRPVRRRRVRRRPRQSVGAAPVQPTRSWERLPSRPGSTDTRLIGRVPSRFLDAIYSAESRRATPDGGRPSPPIALDIVLTRLSGAVATLRVRFDHVARPIRRQGAHMEPTYQPLEPAATPSVEVQTGRDEDQRRAPRRPDRGDLRTAARRRRRRRRLGGQPGTVRPRRAPRPRPTGPPRRPTGRRPRAPTRAQRATARQGRRHRRHRRPMTPAGPRPRRARRPARSRRRQRDLEPRRSVSAGRRVHPSGERRLDA